MNLTFKTYNKYNLSTSLLNAIASMGPHTVRCAFEQNKMLETFRANGEITAWKKENNLFNSKEEAPKGSRKIILRLHTRAGNDLFMDFIKDVPEEVWDRQFAVQRCTMIGDMLRCTVDQLEQVYQTYLEFKKQPPKPFRMRNGKIFKDTGLDKIHHDMQLAYYKVTGKDW